MSNHGLTVPNDYRLRYSKGERQCVDCHSALPPEGERPWLSKGTPYCQYCAKARRDIALNKSVARRWLYMWGGQVFTARLVALDGMSLSASKKAAVLNAWMKKEHFA